MIEELNFEDGEAVDAMWVDIEKFMENNGGLCSTDFEILLTVIFVLFSNPEHEHFF